MASMKFHNGFRKYHRWLGFFLAGIMLIYSVSGILLIFRTTDFLKYEQTEHHSFAAGLDGDGLGQQLRMKGFRVESENAERIEFPGGYYDKQTGNAQVNKKDYPLVLSKLVKLHKATTNSPLFFLNIFFGLGLLFFVVSAFLMFLPKVPVFKEGLKIAGVGALVAVLVVIFGS